MERHTKEWYQLLDKVLDERKEELRKVFLKASVKRKAKNILTAKAKKKKKEQINQYKITVGCAHCGYKDNPDILHFHHLDPSTKIANVSRMVGKNHSMEKIKQEIHKCILLCITCHHKVHDIK